MIALLLACHALGAGPMLAPDNGCTPGQVSHYPSRADVCVASRHPREYTPVAVRRAVLAEYGYGGAPFSGEIDHRIPVFLLGRSTVRNLWPEPGALPNLKDRLETYVYNRVCNRSPSGMRVRTAVRIFLSDWRHAYRFYRDRGDIR